MPTPQLKVRSISRSATPPAARQPFEHRQDRNGVEVDLGAEALGQNARNIFRKAAAGDMGEGLDRLASCAKLASSGFT